MGQSERWESFHVGELQQLLAAVMVAQGAHIFASGPGNLLPRLQAEIGAALDAAAEREGVAR